MLVRVHDLGLIGQLIHNHYGRTFGLVIVATLPVLLVTALTIAEEPNTVQNEQVAAFLFRIDVLYLRIWKCTTNDTISCINIRFAHCRPPSPAPSPNEYVSV